MPSYYLAFSFSTDSGSGFSQLELLKEVEINSYALSIVEIGGSSYLLEVGPFKSEIETKEFFTKIQSSLHWLSLNHKFGIKFPSIISLVESNYIADNSGENNAFIYKGMRPKYFKGFAPTIYTGIGAENVISSLVESFTFKRPEIILEDKKLRLALELYSNYHFERSNYARFITLVNVLEALSPSHKDETISEYLQNQLEEIKISIKKKLSTCNENDSNEHAELKRLVELVGSLKYERTTTMLLNFIENIVDFYPNLGNAKEVRSKVNYAYRCRSLILHTGELDQGDLNLYLSFLSSFIPELLRTLYIQIANQSNR